jgi:aminoglycoside phosphotransferase (APT) family kinase protein
LSTHANVDETPGLDLADLRAFLDRERPGLVGGELRAEVIAGGRSNLTYGVTDGHSSWVVRRPRWATCSRPRTT